MAKDSGFSTEVTNRGFTFIEFVDKNGMRCSIQKSSAVVESCIWLGLEA